jgi:NDP-4-keto-2,6-dideoxyhexose 3-C-methyltransferase
VDVGSFGLQPLTGVFLGTSEKQPPLAPLDLQTCSACSLLQLKHEVARDEMYRTYFYRSSINRTMVDHLTGIAVALSDEFLSPGALIIDTGCNDGTFLKAVRRDDVIRVGVDPSDSVRRIDDPAITVFNDYFPSERLRAFLGNRKASVITSISMFYDINNPHDFINAVCESLADDGVWVVEMNYTGDMLRNAAFDMVSHEHVTYYTLRTFADLIETHGLSVFRIEHTKINGGSIRLYCSRGRRPEGSVGEFENFEQDNGLNTLAVHQEFFARCVAFKASLNSLLQEKLKAGKRIATYGASTRGNAIILFCGLSNAEIAFAADRNPEKVGLYCPGSGIPIVSEEHFRQSEIDCLLILPYGFLEEFISREAAFLAKGGEFIIPFPSLSVLGLRCIAD